MCLIDVNLGKIILQLNSTIEKVTLSAFHIYKSRTTLKSNKSMQQKAAMISNCLFKILPLETRFN